MRMGKFAPFFLCFTVMSFNDLEAQTIFTPNDHPMVTPQYLPREAETQAIIHLSVLDYRPPPAGPCLIRVTVGERGGPMHYAGDFTFYGWAPSMGAFKTNVMLPDYLRDKTNLVVDFELVPVVEGFNNAGGQLIVGSVEISQ
jgi:hypothetical protein